MEGPAGEVAVFVKKEIVMDFEIGNVKGRKICGDTSFVDDMVCRTKDIEEKVETARGIDDPKITNGDTSLTICYGKS